MRRLLPLLLLPPLLRAFLEIPIRLATQALFTHTLLPQLLPLRVSLLTPRHYWPLPTTTTNYLLRRLRRRRLSLSLSLSHSLSRSRSRSRDGDDDDDDDRDYDDYDTATTMTTTTATAATTATLRRLRHGVDDDDRRCGPADRHRLRARQM